MAVIMAQKLLKVESPFLYGYNQIAGTSFYTYVISDIWESQSLLCHISATRPRFVRDGCSAIPRWISVWNSNISLPGRRCLERRWWVNCFLYLQLYFVSFQFCFCGWWKGNSANSVELYRYWHTWPKSLFQPQFLYVPPSSPQLEPKQTEGHSALVNPPTTLSNSGIYKQFRKVPSLASFFFTDNTSLDILPLEEVSYFPVLLNNHSMNLKILNNQHHMFVVGGL